MKGALAWYGSVIARRFELGGTRTRTAGKGVPHDNLSISDKGGLLSRTDI